MSVKLVRRISCIDRIVELQELEYAESATGNIDFGSREDERLAETGLAAVSSHQPKFVHPSFPSPLTLHHQHTRPIARSALPTATFSR